MKRYIFTLILLTSIISSCQHYYYIQNTQNVPLFTEKNQFSGLIANGGGNEIEKFEAQAAFSVTENIAVMGNAMWASGGALNNAEQNNSDAGNGFYFDGALGYYHPLNKYLVFETYGGFGYANQQHHYSHGAYGIVELETSDLSFTKIFIQPSFGFVSNYLDLAVSCRLAQLSFFSIKSYPPFSSDYNTEDINLINTNNQSFLLEPAATLRAGIKSVKIQIQFAYSLNLTNPDLPFEDLSASVGIYIPIRKWNE